MDNVKKARMLATFLHNGQTYGDGEDYVVHLDAVHDVLLEFGCTDGNLYAASYLHDAVEDTQCSLKLIKQYFGDDIEHLVYLVTNEHGKDRKERNIKTYQKLSCEEDGITLKLADRIANARKSKGNERFFSMYKGEYNVFRYFLFNTHHNVLVQKMWKELDSIFYHEQV